MKEVTGRARLLTGIMLLLLTSSCGDNAKPGQPVSRNPASATSLSYTPGTVIDSVREKIKEDELNDLYFRVQLAADSLSKDGDFALKIQYGYAEGTSRLQLPYQMTDARPALHKGNHPYSVYAGFYAGNDTTFHESILINGTPESVRIQKVKDYRLR